jgi:hypothetical protein
MAQHRDGSGSDDLRADDGSHQGGLAAPRRAEKSGDRAARDLHRQIVYGRPFAADDTEMVDDDDRFDTASQ